MAMIVKQGFVSDSALFDATVRNSIAIHIPIDVQERVITSIHLAYGMTDPANGAFEAGRLLILKGRFDNEKAQISPFSIDLPSSVRNTLLYDLFISEPNKDIDFGSTGFSIAADTDVTVVLIRPATNGDVFPLADAMNGFLNVRGFVRGGDDPFAQGLR